MCPSAPSDITGCLSGVSAMSIAKDQKHDISHIVSPRVACALATQACVLVDYFASTSSSLKASHQMLFQTAIKRKIVNKNAHPLALRDMLTYVSPKK